MAVYFSDLNYSLSNEDTSVERQLLSKVSSPAKKVFTICGAGSRVIPLLLPDVSYIKVVDMSEQQLCLLRLRLATIKNLNYETFLSFWGYKDSPISRIEILQSLHLDKKDTDYWLSQKKQWQNGFLFSGRWESFLRKLGVLFRLLFRANFESLFTCQNLSQRQEWYDKNFPIRRLKTFLNIFANPFIFNLFLYKGHFARSQESLSEFLMRVFKIILIEKDPKKSFFAQMLFLGDLRYSEGWPIEADQEVFNSAKNFKGQIEIVKGDLIQELKSHKKFDFLSLSDVASYLEPQQLNSLEAVIMETLRSDGLSVIRSFRRHPEFSKYIKAKKQISLEDWALSVDSIGVYKFHIFSNN
jgi:S-adenosylmethionine-diacylglycerol 3-amino-3-carboxypropyl transferase